MPDIIQLHRSVIDRMTELGDAMNALFEAADAAAAIAEDDPSMQDYLAALMPLLSLTVPPAPPSPTA